MQHVNVDTLIAVIAPVPDSLDAEMLTRFGVGRRQRCGTSLAAQRARRSASRCRPTPERAMLTGVRLPVSDAARAGQPGALCRARSAARDGEDTVADGPLSLVQVTDLGVHARIGTTEGAVWVTGVNDGAAKAGATVVLYDARGRASRPRPPTRAASRA